MRRRRVFIDTSGHSPDGFFGGTSRVIHQLLAHWLGRDDSRWEIVLVHCPAPGNAYERDEAFERVLCRRGVMMGRELPTPAAGDVFVLAACNVFLTNTRHEYFRRLMAAGVKVCALVLDFLSVFRPQQSPPDWVAAAHAHGHLLFALDGVLCISEKVAREFRTLAEANHAELKPGFVLGWSHLGADFRAEAGTPTNAEQAALAQLEDHSFALVVGSIEPRKAHRQTLAAFEQLWAQGNELRLVVFGKHLWLMDEFVGLLRAHEENGHRLHWFEGGSDALLEAMLQRADFLLMPSEDEGFGLPIVEAARRGVPLLLRDIPVFREIAGPHARYFAGMEALELARELGGERRSSAGMTTLTWAQAADNFWHLIEQVDASRP